eukprot:TRINITY_DN9905_c0_g1_i2.p1 TRINITY_DN9905_c0_g1~~TRINITY_DN9905_c0_g1_i2.p1  ORF type:complete len:2023 (-),score=270.08 TRINITY_DN9905_c0_g1_i2:1163-7231(-)
MRLLVPFLAACGAVDISAGHEDVLADHEDADPGGEGSELWFDGDYIHGMGMQHQSDSEGHEATKRELQSSAPLLKTSPPTRVALWNEAFIPDAWVVYELNFFFGQCYENRRIPNFVSAVYSSGTRRETEQITADYNAFDGSLDTNWTAQCKRQLGGCRRHDAWIGLDITDTQSWEEANAKKNEPWNISQPLILATEVHCIKIYQDDRSPYKADILSLREGWGISNVTWRTLYKIDALSGKHWARAPPAAYSAWRMTNLWATEHRWAVTELRFFSDVMCTFPLKGAPMSSGNYDADNQFELNAFDDDLTTHWRALCGKNLYGCEEEEAFLGMDYGETPVRVQCVRMFQKVPDIFAEVSEKPSFSRGISLQAWNGASWNTEERFWDHAFLNQIIDITKFPTLASPYFGGAPGVWEDTRPPNQTAWRIVNDDYTRDQWRIHELQLYELETCEGSPLEGVPIDMQGPTNAENAGIAFDGSDAQDDHWESLCTRGPGDTCVPYEAWIGLYFRPLPPALNGKPRIGPTVKCIRIFQSRTQIHTSNSVQVMKNMNGEWAPDEIHRFIGGGTWNQRPAPEFTQWRVVNDMAIPLQWRVSELRGYRDPLCLQEVTRGNALSSGYLSLFESPVKLFDSSDRSWWGADCTVCNASREYWIGMQLPYDAPDVVDEASLLRCMRIWQSPDIMEQAISLKVEVWDGKDWTFSEISEGGFLEGGGGGIWSRQPAWHMTKWRLMPVLSEDIYWRLEEVEYYADSACSERIRNTTVGNGGASLTASGYQPVMTSFDMATKPPLWNEADLASDGDVSSYVLLDHRPTMDRPAWISLDFLSETTWVRCVRFRQGPLAVQQTQKLRMHIWEGDRWKLDDPETSQQEVSFDGLGGGGWQRRPAADNTLWRVENLVNVPEGWAITELEFHADSVCEDSKISGEPISSGFIPKEADYGPHLAFDLDEATTWLSQCATVPDLFYPVGYEFPSLPTGCNKSDAWLGLDVGALTPKTVKCVRLMQIGYRQMQSGDIGLSKWDGTEWILQWRLTGIGGSSWEQRPSAPNTMWRLVNRVPKTEQCRGQLSRTGSRSWGVADLQFFEDDSCFERLTGGIAISSGAIQWNRQSVADPPSYLANLSLDDDELTTWGANCNLGWQQMGFNGAQDPARVDCTGEWIGMDFRTKAVEVRCVRLIQSRLESPICCDPVLEAELQRWNGFDWVEATWIRDPPQPAIPMKGVITERTHLGAHFMSLGECPKLATRIQDEKIPETRARRDSDKCEVQLTGATSLMADPYCVDHPRCASNFGVEGNCCPFGDASLAMSRCCCSFVGSEPIFTDDGPASKLRMQFDFEYATIFLSNFLPWVGLVCTVLAYFAAQCLPKNVKRRVSYWCREGDTTTKRGRRVLFCKRFAAFLLWPWIVWRHFLATSDTYAARFCCWMVLPNRELPKPMELYRGLIFLLIGFVFAGMAPWIGIGIICGEAILRGLIGLSLVIRWFKSKYNPLDLRDMALRRKITHVKMKSDEETSDAMDVGAGAAVAFAGTMVYFMKFVFDMLIMRSQMIAFGVIETIESDRVVDIFPGLLQLLREPGMLLYNMMSTASSGVSWVLEFAVGLPLCEGSTVLVGAVGLITVLTCTTQWLNYDLFGLFVASRAMCKTTRPECQKIFSQSIIMGTLGLSFAVIQASMLLFTRALMFSNPFKETIWMCEHDDRLALYIGRALLSVSSVGGLVFVFLCVNGHFMGQDYLVGRVGKFLHLDLDDLDPDGTGKGGGIVRCNLFGSAFPTMLGIWLDWWNIEAYLVAERARVYAEVLWDPAPCRGCGKLHTPYDLMMTATGRTISLTAQIVPYGAIVGKASEYLNDPPFFYWGTKLSCMSNSRAPDTPMPVISKKRVVKNVLLYSAETITILLEYVVPVIKRLSSISIYVMCLLATFTLTESNLIEQGRFIIQTAFICSCFKAWSAYFFDPFLSFLLGAIYAILEAVEGVQNVKNNLPRTLVGQVLAGATPAVVLGSSAMANKWADFTAAFFSQLGRWICCELTHVGAQRMA